MSGRPEGLHYIGIESVLGSWDVAGGWAVIVDARTITATAVTLSFIADGMCTLPTAGQRYSDFRNVMIWFCCVVVRLL